jgi:hypothetical protein
MGWRASIRNSSPCAALVDEIVALLDARLAKPQGCGLTLRNLKAPNSGRPEFG